MDPIRVDKKVGQRGDGSSVYETVNDDGSVTFTEQRDPLINNLRQRIDETDWKGLARKGLDTMRSAASNPFGMTAGLMTQADAALKDRFANRDVQPKPPEASDRLPPTGEIDPQQPIAQGPQPQPQPAAIEQANPYRGGGGAGGPPPVTMDQAKLAAGNVGIVPELQKAADEGKAALRGSADEMGSIQDGMRNAMVNQQQARFQAQLQLEQNARDMRQFMDRRMADEDMMRKRLMESANIREPYTAEEKLPVMIGIAIAGLGSDGSADKIIDNWNKSVDRKIDMQVKQYEMNAGMSREMRAQWDARMQTLGDINQAKLSAKMQAVEGAKEYFASHMDLAKTEDAKVRIAQAINKLDMDLAEKQQEYAQNTAKEFHRLQEARRKEAAAAANRAASLEREERHRKEDHANKKELLSMSLDSKESIADKSLKIRGAARAGAAGMTAGQFANALQKYGKDKQGVDEFSQNINNVTEMLANMGEDLPGQGPIAQYIPNFLLSREGKDLRQNLDNLVQSEIYRKSGKAVTDKERAAITKVLNGAGDKSDVQTGVRILRRIEKIHRDDLDARTMKPVRDHYHEQLSGGGQ